MKVFTQYSTEFKLKLKDLSKNEQNIAFVPTMGFLHDGHISLIKKARQENDVVIVSIFINKKQFNNKSDYNNYPVNIAQDLQKLKEQQVDIIYLPEDKLFYQEPIYTNININYLTDKLCGKTRPGHFSGVALVLIKLFNQLKPNSAYFGQKDYQQLLVIKQLVKDLDFPILIKEGEIIRENTGLAMSSRNSRLTELERAIIAPKLYDNLVEMAKNIRTNPIEVVEIIKNTKENLMKSGFSKIDYLEIYDDNLNNCDNYLNGRIFVAVFLGKIRLIDNIKI